ncbi:unnamed protein product [Cunninghamella echinulata]
MDSTFTVRDININNFTVSKNNESSNNTIIPSPISQHFYNNNNNNNNNNDLISQRAIANPILKAKAKPIIHHHNHQNLRFNYSSNIKSQLNQWLQQFNSSNNINNNMSTIITKNVNTNNNTLSFSTRQQQLESDMKKLMNQLKTPHNKAEIPSTALLEEHLFSIKYHLCLFFNASSEWMEINKCYSMEKLFQDWTLMEDYLYGLMGYLKAHEEMLQIDIIQRSDDLLTDINNLQLVIDKNTELYGIQLSTNGYLWKEMGWWVDDHLLNSTKYWYLSICNGVCEEIYNEIIKYGQTEKSMSCIAPGLDLINSTLKFIGESITMEQLKSLNSLIMIYTQWIVQQTESTVEYQLSDISHYQRTNLHYLQLIDNESQVLDAFYSLLLDYKKHQKLYILSSFSSKALANELSLTALPSLLVNIIFNIVTFINQQSLYQHQLNIKRSNIMRTTFLPLLYLEKSLTSLTKSFIIFHASLNEDDNKSYEQRIQWLINLLDDASFNLS